MKYSTDPSHALATSVFPSFLCFYLPPLLLLLIHPLCSVHAGPSLRLLVYTRLAAARRRQPQQHWRQQQHRRSRQRRPRRRRRHIRRLRHPLHRPAPARAHATPSGLHTANLCAAAASDRLVVSLASGEPNPFAWSLAPPLSLPSRCTSCVNPRVSVSILTAARTLGPSLLPQPARLRRLRRRASRVGRVRWSAGLSAPPPLRPRPGEADPLLILTHLIPHFSHVTPRSSYSRPLPSTGEQVAENESILDGAWRPDGLAIAAANVDGELLVFGSACRHALATSHSSLLRLMLPSLPFSSPPHRPLILPLIPSHPQ